MPLFFIISGYVLGNKLTTITGGANIWSFIKNSMIRLLLPAYIFTLFTVPLDHQVLSHPTIYYWFLHSLFRLYMIVLVASLIGRYSRRFIGCYPSLLLSVILCFGLAIPAGNMTLEFVSYFLIGIFLKKTNILEKLTPTLAVVLLVVGIVFGYMSWGNSFYNLPARIAIMEYPVIWLYRQACGVLVSISLCVLCKSVSKRYTAFSKLGTMTLGFYLIHDYIVEMIMKTYLHIQYDFSEWYQWWYVVGIFSAVTLTSYIIIKIIQANKYSKLLLLGE